MIFNEVPASKYASAHFASPRCAKWHYMCFVIAAISASLGFSHEISVDFLDAVHVKRPLVQLQGHYSNLAGLADELVMSDTDVFESKNVDREELQFNTAVSRFNEQLEFAKTEARLHVQSDQIDEIMRGLPRFGEHVDEIITQSRLILQFAEKEEYEAAVHTLTLMNHAGGESSKEMSELNQFIRGIHNKRFEVQLSAAETIRGYKSWFGAGVLLMIGSGHGTVTNCPGQWIHPWKPVPLKRPS